METMPDLRVLTALGFGPGTELSTEPKLLVDCRFLTSVMAELERELSDQGARAALFQIGFMHGWRDALRILSSGFDNPSLQPLTCGDTTPLAIRLEPSESGRTGIQLAGEWPDAYEAEARLGGPGPADIPCCTLSAGYTTGWLSGTLGTNVLAVEDSCRCCGDEACTFTVHEFEDWRRSGDPRAATWLDNVSFSALREVVEQALHAGAHVSPDDGSFDPEAPVVHVWGPVMVLPFTHPDEVLATIESLRADPGTASVRVVVVDLRGSPLDDGFGAAALERALEMIESWGAEAILTGVSPLSEATVGDLETAHLLMRKDLPEAIASAFQIADAQRHLL